MTTDAKILSALRARPDGVSGAQLAEQLKISRAAIWSRIEELRQAGYEIEAEPHLGYRLVNSPDALHADDLLARLAEPPVGRDAGESRSMIVGRDIQVFKETTSTNDVIEKLARDGVREGVVVFAESQTTRARPAGPQMGFPREQGTVVFHFAAPEFASAGNHATDGRLGHRLAPRHYRPNRVAAGNQMAE